jgi:hypothetical protein
MVRHAIRWLGSLLRGDMPSAVEHEMMSAYYLGYAWEDRRLHARSRRLVNGGPLPGESRSWQQTR